MKLNTAIFLLILCPVIFFGCHGGSKPDYPEENDIDDISDIDFDSENNDDADTENETDEDQIPVSDSDNNPIDDKPLPDTDTDSDEISDSEPGDQDSEPDNDDTDPIPDSEPDDDDTDPIPDSEPDDDADSAGNDDDAVVPDNDSIEEADEPAVLCTGQTKCFNATKEITCPATPDKNFFGQDWQYADKGYCLEKSFTTTSNSETVTDNITHLIWQRNLPSTYAGCTGTSGALCAHSEAVNYCDSLNSSNFAGFNEGWRLPTARELGTIIDYGKTNPAIDSEIFPDTPGQLFWTANVYDFEKNWAVNFLKGETTGNRTTGSQSYLYVRCVRGEELPDASFSVSGTDEKILKDSENNLTWTQTFGDYSNWKKALEYCKNLEYAGRSGWRLPNVNELKTLINYSISNPASDFEGMDSSTFWSSTSDSNKATQAWATSMEYGTTQIMSKDNIYKVICVR